MAQYLSGVLPYLFCVVPPKRKFGFPLQEYQANFFAAELLLEDEEVLECLSEHTFFETAKMLYVPAALLDYKFSLLHEKGELANSMYIRKTDFLKGDLHAYDNDIGYGDI